MPTPLTCLVYTTVDSTVANISRLDILWLDGKVTILNRVAYRERS